MPSRFRSDDFKKMNRSGPKFVLHVRCSVRLKDCVHILIPILMRGSSGKLEAFHLAPSSNTMYHSCTDMCSRWLFVNTSETEGSAQHDLPFIVEELETLIRDSRSFLKSLLMPRHCCCAWSCGLENFTWGSKYKLLTIFFEKMNIIKKHEIVITPQMIFEWKAFF